MKKYKKISQGGGCISKSGGVISENKKAKAQKAQNIIVLVLRPSLCACFPVQTVSLLCLHKNKNS